MVRCFPRALDFGQSNSTFYGISPFFKHNFCLAPRYKINWSQWVWFFYIHFPAEIFEFSLNPRSKIEWPPRHLDLGVFRSRYFLKKSLFLIDLRNQFHSIYTFHSMVRSDLVLKSLLLEIANEVLISIVLQMCLFGNLVVILVSLNKVQKLVRRTCGRKDVAMLLKIVKNGASRHFLRMQVVNLESIISLQKYWKMTSINLVYVVPKLAKVWHIDFIEIVVK